MANTVTTRNAVPRGVVVLFAVTAVAITVTLALGSTVCATDASASCPNWPGCYVGRLTPLDATQPWVEFIHRVISASIGLLAVASIIVGMARQAIGIAAVRAAARCKLDRLAEIDECGGGGEWWKAFNNFVFIRADFLYPNHVFSLTF